MYLFLNYQIVLKTSEYLVVSSYLVWFVLVYIPPFFNSILSIYGFDCIISSHVNLFVPAASVDVYKADPNWGRFRVAAYNPTGVIEHKLESTVVSVDNGTVQINNAVACKVELYTQCGALINSQSDVQTATFTCLSKGLLFVKITEANKAPVTMKVLVK